MAYEEYQGYDPDGESIEDIINRLNAYQKMIASTIVDIEGNASQILQQADEIDLRVTKAGVIAAINLSAEGIVIQGSKINLVGAVTVLSDITGNLGTITAGLLQGADLHLQDAFGVIKAGATTQGTTPDDIRFWAGDTYANRGIAPFRVTQGGDLTATKITIGNNLYLGDQFFSTPKFVYFNNNASIEGGLTPINEGALTMRAAEINFFEATTLKFNNATITGFNVPTLTNQLYQSVTESGYCGVASLDNNLTTAIAGVGVNFKVEKTYIPSSITLGALSNNQTPNVVDIRARGFWLYLNGASSISYLYWRGYYTA